MSVRIITELPGPKAKKILARNAQFRYPKERDFQFQFVGEEGAGVYQQDVDGNTFLDFGAGIAVLNTGSCHPRVVRAIQEQATKLIHNGPLYFSPLQVELTEKLGHLAPGKDKKRVYLSNSGTEAVEAALKLARYTTRRPGTIAFLGGFHGRTFGSMSVTSSKIRQRQYYSPILGGVHFAYFPYCYRCPINLDYPRCNLSCLNFIEEVLFGKIISPEEVAAFIVEPIQGEGGYIVPPLEFHSRLKQLAQRHGILYIADEIQSGMGRTGKMFAIEHWEDIEPDIIAFSKGIGSGMPIGGIIGTEKAFGWAAEAHGSTFGGNPVCCAAAIETINVILEEGLLENSEKVGAYLLGELTKIKERYEIIGDVRGKGLMIGIEIVEDKKGKKISKGKRDEVLKEAFRSGLLLFGCGENVVRICPPLVINQSEAKTGLEILEACIQKVATARS